jgi:hypothetical protein
LSDQGRHIAEKYHLSKIEQSNDDPKDDSDDDCWPTKGRVLIDARIANDGFSAREASIQPRSKETGDGHT